MLLERIYLFVTPSRLDGYSPSQQSGLFHVYQPEEKKVCTQISAAGLLGNCGADSSIYGKNTKNNNNYNERGMSLSLPEMYLL